MIYVYIYRRCFVLLCGLTCYSLGGDIDEYPHPAQSPQEFIRYIQELNNELKWVYSPIKRTRRPWIEDWLEILVELNGAN